jgi:exosome complex exonuclease DIS3/RRP44
VLIEHDVPTAPWTVSVLKCLPQPDYEIPEDEIKRRVDLRGENICSIDPPGCTDIDDALHCKPLPNGNFEVPPPSCPSS